MSDFESLDPQTRCVALVGSFLQRYAYMESTLHEAITAALNLGPYQGLIVCKNLQFRDKIHILRTAISRSWFEQSQKDGFDSLLVEVSNYAHNRNMCAHDFFCPTKDGEGVEFVVIKAKGTLKFPDIVWKWEQFETEFLTIQQFAEGMDAIYRAYSAPRPSTSPQEMGNYLARLLQAAQGSDTHPSTPEIVGEIAPTSVE